MKLELVKAVVILPGTALVYVPGAIVWLTSGLPGGMAPPAAAEARFWIGAVLAAAGFAMAVWTVRLFATAGQGTPAPWAPPRKLVILGPYRHVRNPMLSSVNVMLAAESLLSARGTSPPGWRSSSSSTPPISSAARNPPSNSASARAIGPTRRTCRAGYPGGGSGTVREGGLRPPDVQTCRQASAICSLNQLCLWSAP